MREDELHQVIRAAELEPRTHPCPRCGRPDKLTESEAERRGFECDQCYVEIAASMWEGMTWP